MLFDIVCYFIIHGIFQLWWKFEYQSDNDDMDKWLHPSKSVRWNYISSNKLPRCRVKLITYIYWREVMVLFAKCIHTEIEIRKSLTWPQYLRHIRIARVVVNVGHFLTACLVRTDAMASQILVTQVWLITCCLNPSTKPSHKAMLTCLQRGI